MHAYIQVEFRNITEEVSGILIAELTEAGYEGFEEGEGLLRAFIPSQQYDEKVLERIADEQGVQFTLSDISAENWNHVWESNFQPVTIGGFCGLRAGFHPPLTVVEHEIIITPKMSFGTGHHPTTHMMIELMSGLDLAKKRVLDFGTGTGVLAILAAKLGAESVIAIDHDDWSIENARENFIVNEVVERIKLLKSENARTGGKVDIILANINRNVIEKNFDHFGRELNQGGTLVLSGLLLDDESDIAQAATRAGFVLRKKMQHLGWICLLFLRNNTHS